MKDITLETLNRYSDEYKSDPTNKIIENAIKNVGIQKVCLNSDVVKRTYNIFNIELPKSKIYHQGDSLRCWIHAGINLIKNNVAGNLDVEEKEYALSVNYLSFLDKLEKSNSIYNRIIEKEDFEYDKEVKEHYLQAAVYEGGYFEYFRALVNKYGIVPECIMKDVEESKNSLTLRKLFKEKVKKDIFRLLELKKTESNETLLKEKEKMLSQNYNILAKCLGELPFQFDYEYKNKKGECVTIRNITPKEFANKYLTMNLNHLVGIANIPMYNKEYYKLYRKKHTENIFDDSYVEALNMPITVLKELAIKHLKDGIPVYFGCDMKKMLDKELGIMDCELYNYQDIFPMNLLTKEESLSIYDIDYQHVMLLTGVHIENNHPVRWKVEDSYGSETHQDGYYIMNDNFFDEFVIEVMIDKKYLSEEELKLFDQERILFDMDEPF